MLLAVLLAWVGGLLVRTVTADVRFFSDTADHSAYRVAAGAGLTTALLLLLALVAVARLDGPRWLVYLTAAGAATQLALGLTAWWRSRPADDSEVLTTSVWDGAGDVLGSPASWPVLALLAVAVVAAVRGRSRRTPPPLPDR